MAIASALGCKTNAPSTVKPQTNVSRETYFPVFKSSSCSIVDCLKSIGADSSYSYRQRIASKNGVENYRGSAPQNDKLVSLGKKGKLIKP